MPVRFLFICLALAASVSALATRATTSARTDPAFAQIDAIVKTLSEISGLTENHAVPYGRINKKQLRQFLSKRIKKSLKPSEIKADELALKMFGFVPQEFDLRKSTIDLLTEQAAAFYDYDKKRLFLMEESNPAAERMTLAHELSHALADQHFDLEKFMEEKPSNDDENLAHSAVVEGQASWLMIAYSLKESGQNPTPTADMLRSVTESDSASTVDYPVLSDAPAYIRQSLLFPYSHGTAFFNTVFERLGKRAFAEVYGHPPSGSSQILHPDRYFDNRQPTHPILPELNDLKERDEITEGSVSEFDHQMLMRQYVKDARATDLAQHLAGGQFQIDRRKGDRRPVLRYTSEWDSDESASRFFPLYLQILKGKWRHTDLVLQTSAVLAGTGDTGYFITRLNGRFVSSIEGLTDNNEWGRLKIQPHLNPRSAASTLN